MDLAPGPNTDWIVIAARGKQGGVLYGTVTGERAINMLSKAARQKQILCDWGNVSPCP